MNELEQIRQNMNAVAKGVAACGPTFAQAATQATEAMLKLGEKINRLKQERPDLFDGSGFRRP